MCFAMELRLLHYSISGSLRFQVRLRRLHLQDREEKEEMLDKGYMGGVVRWSLWVVMANNPNQFPVEVNLYQIGAGGHLVASSSKKKHNFIDKSSRDRVNDKPVTENEAMETEINRQNKVINANDIELMSGLEQAASDNNDHEKRRT
ncbi:hypothetical protein QVD17_16512 [Tagetes erecta]|uniref:Uncharacterized protein n=1 Tax=Tagetes erecta TaxID=13708 RepID=A0AAD8P0L1_TARER|nr:hypothetical protein QVD17_16512 [Tagetes erecta]